MINTWAFINVAHSSSDKKKIKELVEDYWFETRLLSQITRQPS